MAGSNIKGITVEINGETGPLQNALKDVNKTSYQLKQELKEVEKSLRLDPTNTNLLAQRQTLLAASVTNTREKLETLKTAEQQVQEQFARGDISEEQYRALQREVINTESELRNLEARAQESNAAIDKVSEAAGKLGSAGDKMKKVGTGLSVGLTAPIVAFGAAGVAAFSSVDEAMDTIITKTGATGKAAEELTDSFEEVAGRVPDDLTTVGEAIGEVNTQFGFLGKELEDNSQLMLQFASINGTDVTSSSIAAKQAIEAYGLANSDLNSVLDAVTKTAQDTGQSVDFLFEKATSGAPQIKALGLTFAEGTALIGNFEKAGVDSSAALSSLAKAQVAFAKDGKTMTQGLDETIKSILSAKSETEALTVAAEVFGTKGATRMVDAIKRGTFNLKDFEDAGKSAAGTVKNTFNETVDPIDQAAIAANAAKLAMAKVGDAVQVALLPVMQKVTELLRKLAEWFKSLSPEMTNTILIISGLVAAIGPLLVIFGTIATAMGSLLTLFGTISAAITVVTTGVAVATPAVTALAAAFTVLTGPVGLAIAGIALIATGTALLVKNLSQDAIPATDLFGKTTTDATKKAVGAYMDLDNSAGKSLMNLKLTGSVVSKETANSLIKNFGDMGTQIKDGIDKKFTESYGSLETFFTSSSALTATEEAKILANMKTKNEEKKKETDVYTKQIQDILTKASNEKRALTVEEQTKINNIQETMKTNAVKTLSDTEVESKAILERMKQQSGEITTKQAAEVVKNSLEQKTKAVENAEKQYNETVKAIIKQRDEAGTISADQAKKLIADAEKTKNDTVKSATDMNNKVVEQAKLQAKDHVKEVDWTTGEVKSKWQVMKDDISIKMDEIGTKTSAKWEEIKEDTKTKVDDLKTGVKDSFDSLGVIIANTWDGIKDSIKNSINGVIGNVNSFIAFINNIKINIPAVTIPLVGTFGGYSIGMPQIPSIPMLAEGGITSGPMMALIGDNKSGREAVIPIEKIDDIIVSALKKAGGNSKGIEQTVHIYSPTALSPSETARQNKRALQELALKF